MSDLQGIGERLRVLREKQGLSHEALGEALGITSEALENIEVGRYIPHLWNVMKAARFFNVSIAELLFGTEAER